MKRISYLYALPIILALLWAIGSAATGAGTAGSAPEAGSAPVSESAAETEIPVAPPPFSEGIFPCSRCHDSIRPNRTRRELEWAHQDIVLRHDEENRWCLDCHNADDRDYLHLADGRLVPFTESYRLCGQCHGPRLRAWRAGEHGRRTGSWSGEKQYLLCASCHNPHSPRFKPLEPMPPPVRPDELRRDGDE